MLGLLDFYLFMAGLAIAVLALVQKDPNAASRDLPLLEPVIKWIAAKGWLAVVFLTVSMFGARVWRDRINRSWMWSLIQDLVDRIARAAFSGVQGDAHHHRATLFRYQWCWWPTPFRRWYWPWGPYRGPGSGWLVPIVRSGHTTQRSRTVFLAPDDADNAEGVAGAVWARDQELTKGFHRPINNDAPAKDVEDYARGFFVTVAWVRRQLQMGKVLAASFRGHSIEVKGKKWGVLLLDSRDPNAATNAKLDMSEYAYVLGKLLERT